MEWKPFPTSSQLLVEHFVDGQSYTTSNLSFSKHEDYEPVVFFDGVRHTPSFTQVALLGQIVIKLPTDIAIKSFLRYSIRNPWFGRWNSIRNVENIEQSSQFSELLAKYPEFNPALGYGRNLVHYLLIHKLQYDRINPNPFVAIPQTRFIVIGTSDNPHPVIIQERVKGPSLMSFLDSVLRSRGSFRPPCVKEVLGLANSNLCRHINWYPENFIWAEQEKKFYYIDSKPSTMFGRNVNDQSLRNIREDLNPTR
jgi:hypothetical protein